MVGNMKKPCQMIVITNMQGSNSQFNIHLYDSSSECDKLEDFLFYDNLSSVKLLYSFQKGKICKINVRFPIYSPCL